jgi:parallel beta-helix repeat protein
MVAYDDAADAATFVNSTQLTIALSASDQATVGTYGVVVANPSPGGSWSNAIDFTVNMAAAAQQVVFYVSTLGNDSWSGSLADPNQDKTDGPFATLARAQAAVRALNQEALSATRQFTVYLRGGQYNLTAPLVFTPQDSGTAANPITYAAYSNEAPVLSGGTTISGWRSGGTVAGQQVWTTQVPGVAAGNWYFHQLFVNGVRRQRARTPNTGFFDVIGTVTTNPPSSTFVYNSGDINPAWAGGDVEVVLLQYWEDTRSPILSVDSATNTVTLAGTAYPYASEPNARYWVENTLDALDAPGEWYLDRSSGTLSYIPMPGEDMTQVQVVAPVANQLILLQGNAATGNFVANLRFLGLTFQYTDWTTSATGYSDIQSAFDVPAAVQGTGTNSITIENSTFAELGQYAIALGSGSSNNRIVGNVMTDLGAGGVKIGDPDIPASGSESTANVISNNHISDIGQVYVAATGVWVGQSSGNTIAHNEIHGTYNIAISVGWTWGYGPSAAQGNVIEYNEIYDVGQAMTSDMGGIYTLGVQPGTVVNNNLIHDVTSYVYGGWGVYLDEGSSDILVENNVVYNAHDGGFDFHYGGHNTVQNNIFALGTTAELNRGPLEGAAQQNFTFDRNIVDWTQGPLLNGVWGDGEYLFDDNLYFQAAGLPLSFGGLTLSQWQAQGQDLHSLMANPLFTDPYNGDFSLAAGSPAFNLGFQPIDVSTVGPQPH